MNRRTAREEQLQAAHAALLRRSLATLRASQRGPALPPLPSAEDRALAALATPAERARVDVLLREAGFTTGDLARADALRPQPDNDPVDDLTRRRARQLRGGRS